MTFETRGCRLDFTCTPQDVVGQLGQPSSIMQVFLAVFLFLVIFRSIIMVFVLFHCLHDSLEKRRFVGSSK